MQSKWRIVRRIVFPLLLVVLLCFIFGNSADTGETSGGKSAAVAAFVNGALEAVGLTWRVSELAIRKLAHFAEYALLGLLVVLTWRAYAKLHIRTLGWPLLFGLLTAVLDESFQTLIPGRAGQVTDVLIDFGGVVVGVALGCFVVMITRRRVEKKAATPSASL